MFNLNQENLISTRALGVLLCLTSERIRQLEDEGVFTSVTKSGKKHFDLVPSVQGYIKSIRRTRAAAGSMDDEARKLRAEADWKEAKAAIEEMKKNELEGKMHRSEDVALLTSDMIAKMRGEILALPGALSMDLAEARNAAEASGILKAAVNGLLNRLSEYRYDPSAYAALVREREQWMGEDSADDGE